MRRIRLLLLLLPSALLAQTTPQDQRSHRTITGTVTNAVSGEPIRHTLVHLMGSNNNGVISSSNGRSSVPAANSSNALTGSDGRFQFADIPDGLIMLIAQKPGFFDRLSMSGEWAQSNSWVVVGSGKTDFQLTLSPAARIAGRISDGESESIGGAQVQLIGESITQGRKQWQARGATSTDEDGMYRFDDLIPGHYIVFASGHTVLTQNWNAPPEVSSPAYYPDGADLSSAQVIDVQPGREFRADFHLRTVRGYRVTASVRGTVANQNVSVGFENATGQMMSFDGAAYDGSRGRFVAPAVPSGTWTLILSSNDTQGHWYQTRQEIAVNGADVSNLQILLQPPASIPVVVNHSSGSGQLLGNGLVNIALTSSNPTRQQAYGSQQRGTPPVLTIDNVIEGHYNVDVQVYGNECLSSVSYGNVDLLRDYLAINPGDSQAQPITIDLRADCATLNPKITPEGSQPLVFVVVLPSSPSAEPKVQPAGVPFTLSPGSYQVFAFANLDGLEYANREVMSSYPSQTVNLGTNQKTELTLELISRKEN